jgi:hypothetical protein
VRRGVSQQSRPAHHGLTLLASCFALLGLQKQRQALEQRLLLHPRPHLRSQPHMAERPVSISYFEMECRGFERHGEAFGEALRAGSGRGSRHRRSRRSDRGEGINREATIEWLRRVYCGRSHSHEFLRQAVTLLLEVRGNTVFLTCIGAWSWNVKSGDVETQWTSSIP